MAKAAAGRAKAVTAAALKAKTVLEAASRDLEEAAISRPNASILRKSFSPK